MIDQAHPGRTAPLCAFGILLLMTMQGCRSGGDADDPMVARAFDQYLHWSDLRQVIPVGMGEADSAAMAQAYLTNWVKEQAVLHKAEANLAPADKDFETQLQDHRRSLVLFAYEQALVDQKLDTAVSLAEIRAYYDANTANYQLKDDAVRARWYRVIEPDRRVLKRLEDLFRSDKEEKRHELEIWLAEHGITVNDRSMVWTLYGDLGQEIPVELPRAVDPSQGGKYVLSDGSASWFLEILELRPSKSPIPLELVRRDIRAVLINQRKLKLIERMREDVYREALEQKDIELR